MFKAKNDIGPKLLSEIFKTANYNGPKLRKPKDLKKTNIDTQKYGERSLNFFGTSLWRHIPKK